MLAVYASAAAILLASLVLGSALLHLLGRTTPTWLAGAVGFATLTIAAPLLIRLPGRAATLAILIGLATLAALYYLWRGVPVPTRRPSAGWIRGRRDAGMRSVRRGGTGTPRPDLAIAAVAAVIVIAAASLPFLFNQRNGVLGEGIYTNDQAAQLYWTDWLQHGVGPEPSAVRFGYPTGPQAVAAATAEATNASLLDAFNGLLLAIPVLTALAALSALEALPPARRVVAASLTGLPYLGASFLAQSAFKETAMALLVLAFAIGLSELARGSPAKERQPHPERAMLVALVLIVVASVFVYSLPGLVWFALAVPIWLALEIVTGRLRIDFAAMRSAAARHRTAIVVVGVVVLAVAAFSAAQLSGFVGKVGQVQASVGRLSSPVFPGEALGIWPKGDFRVVRGEVSGAYLAVALGLLAAAIGAYGAIRRRDWGLVAMGASAVIVYVGARLFASIYVEAKALAIMSPLVVLAALHTFFSPSTEANGATTNEASRASTQATGEAAAPVPSRRTSAGWIRGRRDAWTQSVRRNGTGGVAGSHSWLFLSLGVLIAVAFAASTFLALRAAPVGFDERGDELESLAGLIQGRTVAFLGVDRFAGYWLRGTLVRSPGGYVPAEVKARSKKVWQQGLAMDFDTLSSRRLNDFAYVITTSASYQSTAPRNFKPVARTDSYVLWRRSGATPQLGVIDKDGTPGRTLDCATPQGRRISGRQGIATVFPDPVTREYTQWSQTSPFDAPGRATQKLKLGPGTWRLSLQYNSQVPLRVSAPGGDVGLPPSLDGMYITSPGRGAFWPAGNLVVNRGGRPVTITVSAAKPSAFQRGVGVRRQVWLGELAATRGGPQVTSLRAACGRFLDHFTVQRHG